MPGRSFPSAVLAVPSRTPLEPPAPELLTDRMAARPRPPGACGKPVRPAAPEPPPVPGRPALFLSLPLLALFALAGRQVAADGPLRAFDERIGRAVVGDGPARLTEFLADLGNMQVALPVLGCAIVLALVRGARREALYAALTMGAVPALVVPLKAWIARPGPLTDATGYFPSGHAATAAVAYGAAALLVAPHLRRPWSWMMPVAAVLLTTATGIGLVLRGYHWPLDVLGSWFLCGMLLLPLGLSRRSRRRSSSRTPRC